MYDKPMLSLDQVRRAMNAMLDKATQEPDRPVAIAIVDDAGNLLNYARMDGCRANPQTFAVRKAYTSAMSGADSAVYAGRLKSQGRTVADMGNPNLVSAQGAVVVLHPSHRRGAWSHRRERPGGPGRRGPGPAGPGSAGALAVAQLWQMQS